MNKTLFILVIALTIVTSYADNPCVQLCVDCTSTPENETCQKVDQVCGSCTLILDSLQKRSDSLEQVRVQDSIAQEQKLAFRKEQIRALATAIRENSTASTNLFKVNITNGTFLNLTKENGTQEKAKTTPVQEKTDTKHLFESNFGASGIWESSNPEAIESFFRRFNPQQKVHNDSGKVNRPKHRVRVGEKDL